MAFTQQTFAPVGGVSTKALTVYSYRTDDANAEITSTGYFDEKKGELEENDLIFAFSSEGYFLYQVTADTGTVFPTDILTGDPPPFTSTILTGFSEEVLAIVLRNLCAMESINKRLGTMNKKFDEAFGTTFEEEL